MPREKIAEYSPEHYINRDLSWLDFNARVLEEASDAANPCLERLKFLAIFSSNLDEFFEIRVAGLRQQLQAGMAPQDFGADGLGPAEQLAAIQGRTHDAVAEQYRMLTQEVLPGLAERGVERVRTGQLTEEQRSYIEQFFSAHVYPVLTPLAIDPGHPFPHVHNKSLNIALLIERTESGKVQQLFAVVQVPAVLARVVVLPRDGDRLQFLLLEDVIASHLSDLFGGFRVLAHTVFRVTRNTDFTIDEDEAANSVRSIDASLRQRIRREAVRLEIAADADERFIFWLSDSLGLKPRDVYRVDGPVDLTSLLSMLGLELGRSLKDSFIARVPRA
jgi:polyphosphate kinase